MAEVLHSLEVTSNGDELVTWASVGESDTFERYEFKEVVSEISVHAYGTFGGATLTFKGANYDADGVTLQQMDSTSAQCTAEDLLSILDRPLFITPTHSGGSSESVTIKMLVRK